MEHLFRLVSDGDVYGMPGTPFISKRANLMVTECEEIAIQGSTRIFSAMPMIPMGSSAQLMRDGIFLPYSDEPMGKTPMKISCPSNFSLPTGVHKMMLWNVRDSFPTDSKWMPPTVDMHMDWYFDDLSQVFSMDDRKNGPIRHLELFAGGHGGWAYATRFVRHFSQTASQTVAVEYDLPTIANYAVNHGSMLVSGEVPLPKGLLESGLDVAIHMDVTSRVCLPQLADWKPDVATVSAPCGPWSKAGSESGLASPNGFVFAESIAILRWIRPRIILLENVPGFSSHPHSVLILQQLRAAGYRIRWCKTLDAAAWSCATRTRWLCVASLMHDSEVHFEQFEMWPSNSPRTPNEMNSVLPLSQAMIDQIQIPEKAKQICSDPKYLPQGQRHLISKDDVSVWTSRGYTGDQTLPTFMAQYGNQHCLPLDLMAHKGCYMHFFQPAEGQSRYWHPLEVAAHHLVWDSIAITNDLPHAWMIQGNQIAMPHALLLIANAYNMLPRRHPKIAIDQLFLAMWDSRLQASDVQISQWQYFATACSSTCHTFDATAVQHANQLFELLTHFQFKDDTMWSIKEGVLTHQEWLEISGNVPYPLPSQVSIQTVSSDQDQDDPMTQPFLTMQAGRVIHQDNQRTFWYQQDITLPECTHLWSADPEIATCTARILSNHETADTGYTLEITPCQEDMHDIVDSPSHIVVYVKDSQLSLYRIPSSTTFAAGMEVWNIPQPLEDQFGQVTNGLSAHSAIMLMPPALSEPLPVQIPAIVLSAFHSLQHFAHDWNLESGEFRITGKGPTACVNTMIEFWALLIPQNRLMHLGLKPQIAKTDETFEVKFVPTGCTCPMPPYPFWVLLSVAATRTMLKGFQDDDGCQFDLKWLSRPLWSAKVAKNVKIEQIESVLRCTLKLTMNAASPRLICQGRQYFNVSIEEIADMSQSMQVKCHVIASLHGGGSKDINRTQVKNSLAATLLESGYELGQVTEVVDVVLNKAGLKKAMTVARLPGGRERFQQVAQLCKDCQIQLPEPKNQAFSSSHAHGPKAKKQMVQLVPQDYTIEPGFLCNHDLTPVQQIAQVTSASTGVCLVDAAAARPWLRESQIISKDELAIFILDPVPPDTTLDCESLLLPCRDKAGNQVIISGYLVQLGAKHVQQQDQKSDQVNLKKCVIAALTIWKDDWQASEWTSLLKQTSSTLRQILGDDGNEESMPTMWGRSLRAKGKACTEGQAESIQIHCTISHDAKDRLLAKSGFSKVFITPKGDNGRSSEDYKVIWLKGDLVHVTAQAAKTQTCAGLIRGKQNFGLRFDKSHFQAAWQILCPNQALPSMQGGSECYKLSPLPYGCPATALRQWGANHNWEIRPVKALGARTWLVTTDKPPPQGILVFNGTPIIAQYLPPRAPVGHHAHAIVAGPRPQPLQQPTTHATYASATAEDPWATYRRLNPQDPNQPLQPAPRANQGPIETQFQQQSQRITELEKTIQVIAKSQEDLKATTEKNFHEVAQRDTQTREYVAQSMDQIRRDLQTSLQQATEKQASDLKANMDDLKKLFTSHVKTKRAREQEPMEDSDDS